MKTLKQIREDYDIDIEQAIDLLDDELMLEGSILGKTGRDDTVKKGRVIPSAKEMPVLLIFRRLQYRIFPNKQVVALYYSQMIDKYLSVPIGPGRNVNLSEAVLMDDLTEDWQKVNRQDKTDGLSQKAVNAYRSEHPGSKLKTAVTEKNPSGKRAARRKSFCSRMGGMKKRLTSAKTARDPDSRINKALRRWNCEEDFKLRLNELRIQRNEGLGDAIEAGRQWVHDKVKDSKTFKAAQELGHKLPGYGNVQAAKKKFAKGDYWGAAKETGKSLAKAAATGAAVAGAGYLGAKALPKLAKTAASVASGLKSGATSGSKGGDSASGSGSQSGSNLEKAGSIKTGSTWSAKKSSDAVTQTKLKQAALRQVKENKMTDIRAMVESDNTLHEMNINGKTVTLNTSMAKRILEVYDSVNTKNKKIVEGMLNEDLESFKKLLNFSIRN